MVRHASLFSQLVALFNRQRFYELVYRHRSERYAKGFSSWDQFVAMLFCQLGQAKSLREISGGLASAVGKLRHLGVKAAPNKSTLSYANAHRPWQLFQDLFYEMLQWCQTIGTGQDQEVSVQKQATLTGQQYHIVVSVAFSLGEVSPHQGSRQTAHAIGSRWVSAQFCLHH